MQAIRLIDLVKNGEILESKYFVTSETRLQDVWKKELGEMPNWILGRLNINAVCMSVKIPISCAKID